MPVRARGLFSGLLQQGYAVGCVSSLLPYSALSAESSLPCSYLVSAVINLTLVPRHNSYQILFYFAGAVSFFAALVRLVLPESAYFLERRAAEKAQGTTVSSGTKSKIFLREAGRALRIHWARCVFAVIIMSLFNFFISRVPLHSASKLLRLHSSAAATSVAAGVLSPAAATPASRH